MTPTEKMTLRTEASSVRKSLPCGRLFRMEESRTVQNHPYVILPATLFFRKASLGQFSEKKAPGITGMIIPVGPIVWNE